MPGPSALGCPEVTGEESFMAQVSQEGHAGHEGLEIA